MESLDRCVRCKTPIKPDESAVRHERVNAVAHTRCLTDIERIAIAVAPLLYKAKSGLPTEADRLSAATDLLRANGYTVTPAQK